MYAFTPFANADWGSVYGGFIGFCVDFSVFDCGFWRLVIACTLLVLLLHITTTINTLRYQ
jgi:hypothetical protein